MTPPAALWFWLPSLFVFDLASVGAFITYLALGDLVLAVATIASVKAATRKTHRRLLTNT